MNRCRRAGGENGLTGRRAGPDRKDAMVLILLFLKSLLLGLAIAAPLGPIGALCINRTLERGLWAGVAGGLGTALADALYASLAASGLAAFASVLVSVDGYLRAGGGLFMLILGLQALLARPADKPAEIGTAGLGGTVAATFLLTMANPMTILSFAAVFAGLGLARAPGALSAVAVVSGVFIGSLAWWFFLSGTVVLVHRRLPEGFARWVSRLSGGLLVAFGAAVLVSLVW